MQSESGTKMPDVKRVNFRSLKEATQADIDLIYADSQAEKKELPGRLVEAVRSLAQYQGALPVSRMEHSLQSATRAFRDGRDEDYIVTCLLHDIGDALAPYSHGAMVAAVLRPFVSDRLCWIIEKHQEFQNYYTAHYFGGDRNVRDKYKDEPYYEDCKEFCELYDQSCFDPDYESLPLEFFAPMIERVCSQARKDRLVGADA